MVGTTGVRGDFLSGPQRWLSARTAAPRRRARPVHPRHPVRAAHRAPDWIVWGRCTNRAEHASTANCTNCTPRLRAHTCATVTPAPWIGRMEFLFLLLLILVLGAVHAAARDGRRPTTVVDTTSLRRPRDPSDEQAENLNQSDTPFHLLPLPLTAAQNSRDRPKDQPQGSWGK